MVPGYVANPGELEAAPLEVQGQIPNNKPYITELCTNIFCTLLLLGYMVWSVYLLVMQPKTPKFKVESATVQLHAQGPELTAEWDITFLATNHNFNIYYKHIQAGFLYEYGPVLYKLVRAPRRSFVSKRGSHSRVEWKFNAWKEQLGYQVVEEISSGEGVSLGFGFMSSVWFMSTLLPPQHAWVDALCRVDYRFSPNNRTGNLTTGTFTSHKCVSEYYKNYMFEVLIICSWVFLAFWTCFCAKRPKTPARIAPS